MLRAVIISPDVEQGKRLAETLDSLGRVGIVKTTDRYMTGHELERFLRASAPQIVFISIQSMSRAMDAIGEIEHVVPAVQIVAIERACAPETLLDLMRNGVREFLNYPFEPAVVMAAVARMEEILARKPAVWDASDLVFSFLPAKAGAGTSTIALNAAVALSRQADMRVLLQDLDLNSGMLGFMLKLETPHTIYEAAENAEKMDEHLWPQLVSSVGNLDVLPAGRLDPQARIEPIQVRRLIAFARRFYGAICVDLSGNMEKYSLEVIQDSKRVFVVSTPEIPSLHLARQKIHLLSGMDLGDRVSVLLNRAQRRSIITPQQVEQLLGVPVFMEFPNDYRGVHQALTAGREVSPESELGKQFTQLSYSMLDKSQPKLGLAKKRKFLEFLSLTPARMPLDAQPK